MDVRLKLRTVHSLLLCGLMVLAQLSYGDLSLVNADECPCLGAGETLVYRCTVKTSMAGGFTIWQDSLFTCPNEGDRILLRHNSYDDPGGAFGRCTDGKIAGRSVGTYVIDGMYNYVSQVEVSTDAGFFGKHIRCIHSPNGNTLINRGNLTLDQPITEELLARPFSAELITVYPESITVLIGWNSVSSCQTPVASHDRCFQPVPDITQLNPECGQWQCQHFPNQQISSCRWMDVENPELAEDRTSVNCLFLPVLSACGVVQISDPIHVTLTAERGAGGMDNTYDSYDSYDSYAIESLNNPGHHQNATRSVNHSSGLRISTVALPAALFLGYFLHN